jgi:hypothetical protein
MRRRHWLTFVLGVAALAALARLGGLDGKSIRAAEQGNAKLNYYPMQVGNQWHYRVGVGDNFVNSTYRITKLDTFDGQSLARLEALVSGNVVAREHLRQTENGIFRYRNNDMEISPPLILFKYPLKDKWDGTVKVGKDTATYTCESKAAEVEVPAGKYSAIRVNLRIATKGQEITTSYWFAQNVGIVKQTVDAGGVSAIMELEKFEPAKDKEPGK